MRNPSLLAFLSAVDVHARTGVLLTVCSGFDHVELGVAVSVAKARGFVAFDDAAGTLDLTEAARAWIAAELAPFARFLETPEAAA